MTKKMTKRQTEVPLTGAFGVVVVFIMLLYVLEGKHFEGLKEIAAISEMTLYTNINTGAALKDQGDLGIYGGLIQELFEPDSRPPKDRTTEADDASSTVGKLVAVLVTEDSSVTVNGIEELNDNLFGAIDWPSDTSRVDRITQICLSDNTWTLHQSGDYPSESFYPKEAQIGFYKLQGMGLRRVSQSGKIVPDLQYDLSKSVFKEREGTRWLYQDDSSNEKSCTPDTLRVMHLHSQPAAEFTVLAMHAGNGELKLYDYGDADRPIFKSRPGALGRRQLFREEIGPLKRTTQVLRVTFTGTTFLFLCIASIPVIQASILATMTAAVSIGFFDWWFWGLGDVYVAVCLTLPFIFALVIELILRNSFNRYMTKRKPAAGSSSGKTSPAAAQRKKRQ